MGQIRVFVIEDHELVRDALGDFIGRDETLAFAGSAATAADGLAALERVRPDVALLDVYLPDGNGIEVCRDIKSRHPEIKCVILTGAGDTAFVEAVLAGAEGYIGKEARFAEISKMISEVAQGRRMMDPAAHKSILDVLRDDPEVPEMPALKAQEVKLLELIGRGLTNRRIGEELNLAEQTVKNYVSALLGKLGLERRAQAAALAVEYGITRGRLNAGGAGVDG